MTLTNQLKFAREIHSAMVHADLKRVVSNRMTPEEAARRNETMAAIVATLDKLIDLEQVSAEMAAEYRRRALA